MAFSRVETVNEIVNRAAVEVGLPRVTDVFAAGDDDFRRMIGLLNGGIQELMEEVQTWAQLYRPFQYTTTGSEVGGRIELPPDFAYMIDQTGWERSNRWPMLGPLTPQEWTYLEGRNLASGTIFPSFRFQEYELFLFPNDPTPAGLDITFLYMSRNLVYDPALQEYSDVATKPNEQIQFPPNLIIKMLKMKFLNSKGFDASVQAKEYQDLLESIKGNNNGGRMLRAGGFGPHYPYLNPMINTPDTGFGGV